MHEIHGHAGTVIEREPRALFAAITDIERLPEWNAAIEKVIECPERLVDGASWTVGMHPTRGMRWKSVSTLQELDPGCLRFSYRTVNADGSSRRKLMGRASPSGGTSTSRRLTVVCWPVRSVSDNSEKKSRCPWPH